MITKKRRLPTTFIECRNKIEWNAGSQTSGSQIFILFFFPFLSLLIYLYFEAHFGEKGKEKDAKKLHLENEKICFCKTRFNDFWISTNGYLLYICSTKDK